jgi:outer membrane protein TolC
MYRLEATLAEVDARAAEAHHFEAAALAALRVLTGRARINIPECPIAPVAFEPQPLGAYLDRAHQDRPEIGLLQAAMDARRADLQAQRAGYFPDLVLALQASRTVTPGRTDQSDPFITDAANITLLGAALVLEWDLDLWGNSARVRGAESRLSLAEAQSAQARDGVDLEIAVAHASVQEAREREQAWSRGHQNTRRWFVAAAQGYEVGAREPKDLIDALKAYFTARFSHLQSIHDQNVAVARLEQAVGAEIISPEAWAQSCEIIDETDAPPATADAP